MKTNLICKVVLFNRITGKFHDKAFYGIECANNAANFVVLHPEFKLVSCEILEND